MDTTLLLCPWSCQGLAGIAQSSLASRPVRRRERIGPDHGSSSVSWAVMRRRRQAAFAFHRSRGSFFGWSASSPQPREVLPDPGTAQHSLHGLHPETDPPLQSSHIQSLGRRLHGRKGPANAPTSESPTGLVLISIAITMRRSIDNRSRKERGWLRAPPSSSESGQKAGR